MAPLESANLVTIKDEQLLCHDNFSDIIQSLFIQKRKTLGDQQFNAQLARTTLIMLYVISG